jgi:hypothetical protein
MENELKKKLESKKSNGKTKAPCKSCKKKAAIPIKLPEPIDIEEFYVPTREDIHLAYVELGNRVADKREFINKVYMFLFNEEFNFGCRTCVNGQARKLKNYIIENLKIPL